MSKLKSVLCVVLFAALLAVSVPNVFGQVQDQETVQVNLTLLEYVILTTDLSVIGISPPAPPLGNWTRSDLLLVTIEGSVQNASVINLYLNGSGPFVDPVTLNELPLNGVDFSITGESGDMVGIIDSFLEAPILAETFIPALGIVSVSGDIAVNYKNDLRLPGSYSTSLVLTAIIE